MTGAAERLRDLAEQVQYAVLDDARNTADLRDTLLDIAAGLDGESTCPGCIGGPCQEGGLACPAPGAGVVLDAPAPASVVRAEARWGKR